jgi:hypothetical protein
MGVLSVAHNKPSQREFYSLKNAHKIPCLGRYMDWKLMCKSAISIVFLMLTLVACVNNGNIPIVEISPDMVKVDGDEVQDFLSVLKSKGTCKKLHFIIELRTKPEVYVNLLNLAKEAKCENVSIQTI